MKHSVVTAMPTDSGSELHSQTSISIGYKSNSRATPQSLFCVATPTSTVWLFVDNPSCVSPGDMPLGVPLCFPLGHGDVCTGYDLARPGNPKTQQPTSSPCHGGIPPACWPSEPSSPVAKGGHDNRTHPCTHNSRFGQAQAGHFFFFKH